MNRKFFEMLKNRWDAGARVCVGLDPDVKKIPPKILESKATTSPLLKMNELVIDATKDSALCYKPNRAFYKGPEGLSALRNTIAHIRSVASDVPLIYDAKFGDIGNTNNGYVEEAFDWLKADAVTIHCYMGMEAMRPFLDRADKGVLVLCKTSNPGSGEFQNLLVDGKMPLSHHVAAQVASRWNYNGNCGLVVGATYPDHLAEVRAIVKDMPILIPGIGTQGGDVHKTVQAGRNSQKSGMIINSSSGIMFSHDPKDALKKLTEEIDAALVTL